MRPSIQFRMPPSWFFKFPPDEEPPAIPPPTDARTFASPFAIRPDIYVGALDYKVPITIAFLYASTVIIWNRVNRDRGYKPYGFSKTAAFKAFVIAHNIFLAVFSAFTFVGMIRALAHTWPGREHHLLGKFWPGLRTANGIAGATDALCKMHGPRGFGSAVSYDPFAHSWGTTDSSVSLTADGLPDTMDVGRLWNEGLAFWGWWFYLSKFYEVFDTFIILSKGKRSSTLQTYHHTGAMMCMWAGIRYMSPPIWMFCFLNSGIHAMMYVYYTLSALSIRVPQRIKRTLTTMQISQFIIGITFAAMHLFVTYTIPVSTAYTVSQTVESIASSMVAGASSAVATASSAGVASWLKQAALRAAGEQGLAENVLRENKIIPHGSPRNVTKYATGYETIPCIDTNGQAFAVWLNLAYLAPLTGLFVRFFIRSYVNRGGSSRHPTHKRRISKSIKDAAHGTNREIDSLGKSVENSVGDLTKEFSGKTPNGNGNGTPRSRKVSSSIEKKWERFEKGAGEESPVTKPTLLRKKTSDGTDKLRKMFEEAREVSPKYTEEAVEKLEDAAETAVKNVQAAVGMSPEDPSKENTVDEEAVTDEPKKDDLEGSWTDIHEETYAYKEEQKEAEAESEEVEAEPKASPTLPTPAEEQRSRSPAAAHSSSPKKSQIPRLSSAAPSSRSRSPVKKQSSIPRPSSQGSSKALGDNTNGTKQQRSKSSGSSERSESKSATSHSTRTVEEDTNGKDEQVSSEPASTKDSSTEEQSSGGDDKLRWRHVSDGDAKAGGDAEREEGKSFADAVIDGESEEAEKEAEKKAEKSSVEAVKEDEKPLTEAAQDGPSEEAKEDEKSFAAVVKDGEESVKKEEVEAEAEAKEDVNAD